MTADLPGPGPEPERPATPARRRFWLVRAVRWLVGFFWAPLVSGEPEPPPPRPRWRMITLPRWPERQIDIVVAAEIVTAIMVFVAMVAGLNLANDRSGNAVADGELLVLASFAAAAPLLLRDRWPLAAWRVAMPAMIFVAVISRQAYSYQAEPPGAPPTGAVITYLLVLYAVGARCSRRISMAVWLFSFVGMWILYPSSVLWLGGIAMAAALVYGYNVRVRRQAQRQVVEEEQRTADERAARAVLAERSRIARELHDVVAHHMSVIAIQAEAAPLKAPTDPEALKAELAGIRGTALEALAELRRVLGVLRTGDEEPVTAPQPDLAGLDQLLASARAAGLAVTVTTRGRIPATAGGVGRTAYRILQESLSNALRHAPGAPVRVELSYQEEAGQEGQLSLRVENGPPPRPPVAPLRRGGQGLAGMRERVASDGGTLTTGPTADGGFLVAATLPVPARAGVRA